MSEDLQNYEMVSIYRLNADDQERLLNRQRECVFNWCTKDEWPVGVIMSYIWRKGRVWLTGGAHRHRISAVRRNPKVSVVITSTGTDLGPSKTITIKGRCVVHEDRETKDWFYPDFARALRPEEEAAKAFQEMLDSPLAGGAGGGAGEVHHLRRRKDVGAHRRHLRPCRVGGALGVRHRAPAAGNQAAAPVGGPARWVAQHRRRSPILAAGPS